MTLNTLKCKCITVIMTIGFFVTDLFARAGGAGRSGGGGSFSSSSSSSFGSSSSSGSGGSLTFGEFLFFAGIMVFFFIVGVISNAIQQKKQFLNNFPDGKEKGRQLGLDKFKEVNQTFSETTFLRKVDKAFLAIQDAWSKQDLSGVRRYLSDGVWQRFTVQFLMMKELEQTNPLSRVEIKRTFIDAVESDGMFDIIHVGIEAGLMDHFKCGLDESLNSGGYEHFVEYWSFIRKKGAEGKDMYSVTNCPSCSAPMGDSLAEVAICPFCNAVVNSGEYDWVLSEITQAEDYTRGIMLQKQQNLSARREELSNQYNDFTVQNIEDRVSNGFMQILAAKALNQPERVRRFVTDALFEHKLKNDIASFNMLYNRLYTNDVSLLAAISSDDKHELYVGVTYSAQRVSKMGNTIQKRDGAVHTLREVIRIERTGDMVSDGQLYMHRCSTCGAPVHDTTDVKCPYCQAVLNSSEREWIISDILTPAEYREQLMAKEKEFDFSLDTEILDGLLSVKDYAITNVIAMIACDGHIDETEIKYLKKVAKQLHYSKTEIVNIEKIARSGMTAVRMPEDMNQRKKIFKLMEKAAKADNKIVEAEAKLLEFVQLTYLLKQNT